MGQRTGLAAGQAAAALQSQGCSLQLPSGQRNGADGPHWGVGGQSLGEALQVESQQKNLADRVGGQVSAVPQESDDVSYEESGQATWEKTRKIKSIN